MTILTRSCSRDVFSFNSEHTFLILALAFKHLCTVPITTSVYMDILIYLFVVTPQFSILALRCLSSNHQSITSPISVFFMWNLQFTFGNCTSVKSPCSVPASLLSYHPATGTCDVVAFTSRNISVDITIFHQTLTLFHLSRCACAITILHLGICDFITHVFKCMIINTRKWTLYFVVFEFALLRF